MKKNLLLFALSLLCTVGLAQNQAITVNPTTHQVVNPFPGSVDYPKGITMYGGRPLNTNIFPFTANVLNYGAIGNGITNDWPAVQRAYQAVTNHGGGTLEFPDNMTFLMTNQGVNFITVTNSQSNIEIKGGVNTVLLMSNLDSDGLASGAGIAIFGPGTNYNIHDIKVGWATMSSERQGSTFAPIYILGANVGEGDTNTGGWYRGNISGTEDPAGIDAGAVRNVKIENVTLENSPSVGMGIVGVDGIKINNLKLHNTWADGLYHVYFRNSQIDGVLGLNVGDDAISLASYESDLSGANITNAYHGEGSRITNVRIEGTYPPDGATNANLQVPAAAFAILGVRDVVVNNYNIDDKFRALRFATGLETNSSYALLHINNLANMNVLIDNMTARNCFQAIAVDSQQSTVGEDPKWWNNQNVKISHFTADNLNTTFTVYSDAPMFKTPVMSGIDLDNITMSHYQFGTVGNFTNCNFNHWTFDGTLNVAGFVPFTGNPDASNTLTTLPVYPAQNSSMTDITAREISCIGLKHVYMDDIRVRGSIDQGFVLSSSADITINSLMVQNPNFTNANGVGASIDAYCRRVNIRSVFGNSDTNAFPNLLSIVSTNQIWVDNVFANTKQNTGYYLVADQQYNLTGAASVGRIDWLNSLSGNPRWIDRQFGGGYQTPTTSFDFFPTTLYNLFFIEYPMSANATATLHPDGAKNGDTCTISRVYNSSGNYAVTVQGVSPNITGSGETPATGGFIIEKGSLGNGTISGVTVNSVAVMGSAVPVQADLVSTAGLVCSNINYYQNNVLGSPVYVANNYSSTWVSIQNIANNNSASMNGHAVAATTTGDAVADNFTAMTGGFNPVAGSGGGSPYSLWTSPSNQQFSATFVYGEGTWHFQYSTVMDTNLLAYQLALISATNAPSNNCALRWANGAFYWGP